MAGFERYRRVEVVTRRRATPPQLLQRRKAEELMARGMPLAMALAVAQGRIPLNEALERLSRRTEVDRLMKAHDMSRALATQVVLGQADLDSFLAKRRFETHRGTHRDRSVLDEAKSDGRSWHWALFGGRKVEGKITDAQPYEVELTPTSGAAERLHKLAFKYGLAADEAKKLRKSLSYLKALQDAPRAPAERPQERYTCSDKRLFRYIDSGVHVRATLLEGEVIEGTMVWFSRFEFALAVKGGATVVIFRHALHDLSEVDDK